MKTRMTFSAMGALLALAATSGGQVPILEERGGCVGLLRSTASPKLNLQPKEFSVLNSGICSQYSEYGWAQPLRLYLGEGAEEYLSMIEQAARVWNSTLKIHWWEEAIQIVTDLTPSRFELQEQFWYAPTYFAESRNKRRRLAICHLFQG